MDESPEFFLPESADGERVVAAARTGLGDDLRSVVAFTPGSFEVLYTRADLYDPEVDVDAVKRPLVELERVGFAEAPVRTSLSVGEPSTDIGPYGFTVRFHDHGFVVRVIEGDRGVLLTTDTMDSRAFREAATAIRTVLRPE
ncbi:DUF7522 family protein [Halobaculum litoreum]|uniref:Uncharacterized protein n=1 Tax=Halobaculum litoreum TaxID=3031998 RepID=A0ABD5XM71_9EURY|nr:hypothetical protein [Halobaculum sp. DT92]